MNLIQSLITTGTIALVSFTSLPVALSETGNSNFLTRKSTQMMGTPRQYESPAAKVQDIKNAVASCKPYL